MRLRGLQCLRRLIVVGARCPTIPEKPVLSLEMISSLGQLSLRSSQAGLRGPQCVHLVLGLETRHYLPRLYSVTEFVVILNKAARYAERKRNLVFRLDTAREHYRRARFAPVRRHSSHGTDFRSSSLRLWLARCQH